MSLKEIYCQTQAITTLQKALASGKTAHAYIFTGAEGVGKFKTASQWAKLLLCQNPVKSGEFSEACGKCHSCQLIDANSHPDFIHIYKELIEYTKEGKDKKTPVDMPIDVIREFLIEKVSVRPSMSQRKVYVISQAERLNNASQNALLKVLEEPPAYCTIILLCTELEKLLATTKSRCQTIRFGPIAENIIIDKLKQQGVSGEKAKYFARLSDGSIGAACTWAKLETGDFSLYETKKRLVKAIASYKYADSLEIAERLSEESKKMADIWAKLDEATSKTEISRRAEKTFIRIIVAALSDAMKLNLTQNDKITNFDQLESIKAIAGRLDCEQAAAKIVKSCELTHWIDANVNERLIFERLLLNLSDFATILV
jgi:DNA polymerase III subunit delta'